MAMMVVPVYDSDPMRHDGVISTTFAAHTDRFQRIFVPHNGAAER